MPPHPSYNLEKSPVDHWDFSGLQLDTRARENSEKHLDASKPQGFLDDDFDEGGNYLNEKQSHTHLGVSEWGPASPDSTVGSTLGAGPSPITPTPLVPPKSIDEALGAPPPIPPERRILGLRRKPFWILFGTILALVIAAAVVGGVVGGLQARNGKSGSLSTSSAPPALNGTNSNAVPLNSSDVMVGSPLSVVTYDEGPGESYRARQAFRVVYQSAIGDIKEAVSYHEDPWLVAVPIFSTAINHTGLASATYLNDTSQQGSVFYVGTNGLLQENRKIYNNSDPWIPGTLNNLNLAAAGNFSAVTEEAPQNGWDGYRMAAVYSPNFQDGPGIRLFYHAKAPNGTSFVQELIWNLKNDAWSKGATFSKPYAYSHLAAVVDESQKILRLLFSSGGKTLSEEWLDISNIQAGYSAGLDLAGLLYNDAADIAAVSLFGTTYVYHYSAASQKAEAGIHELMITGMPSSVNSQETYNLSSPLVAAPLLNSSNGVMSLYQPLAASYTAVPGLTQQLFVIWADKPSGDPKASVSGFSDLQEISRSLAKATWESSTQMSLPLGSQNVGPPDPGAPGTPQLT